MTCLPLPLPSAAPPIRPSKSPLHCSLRRAGLTIDYLKLPNRAAREKRAIVPNYLPCFLSTQYRCGTDKRVSAYRHYSLVIMRAVHLCTVLVCSIYWRLTVLYGICICESSCSLPTPHHALSISRVSRWGYLFLSCFILLCADLRLPRLLSPLEEKFQIIQWPLISSAEQVMQVRYHSNDISIHFGCTDNL